MACPDPGVEVVVVGEGGVIEWVADKGGERRGEPDAWLKRLVSASEERKKARETTHPWRDTSNPFASTRATRCDSPFVGESPARWLDHRRLSGSRCMPEGCTSRRLASC
jgi:hypothetical protein